MGFVFLFLTLHYIHFCCTMVEVRVMFDFYVQLFEYVVHLSSKSCLNCRPWGKVMSSKPDSTPIALLCSSVTPTMRATCPAKQSEIHGHFPHCHPALVIHPHALFSKPQDDIHQDIPHEAHKHWARSCGSTPINCANNNTSGGEDNLTVHTEHVQRWRLGVWSVEELLECQQHAGLQRSVVVR